MIIENKISLMDENYFNFQMEMINLESSFTFYSNCIEYTNESENIFIKIKNGMLKYLRKIIEFIKDTLMKKFDSDIIKCNKNMKIIKKLLGSNLKYPIKTNDGCFVYTLMNGDRNLDQNFISPIKMYKSITDIINDISKPKLIDEFDKILNIILPDRNYEIDITNLKPLYQDFMDKDFRNIIADQFDSYEENYHDAIEDHKNIDKIDLTNLYSTCANIYSSILQFKKRIQIVNDLNHKIESNISKYSIDDHEIIKIFNNTFTIFREFINTTLKLFNFTLNAYKKCNDNISNFLSQVLSSQQS